MRPPVRYSSSSSPEQMLRPSSFFHEFLETFSFSGFSNVFFFFLVDLMLMNFSRSLYPTQLMTMPTEREIWTSIHRTDETETKSKATSRWRPNDPPPIPSCPMCWAHVCPFHAAGTGKRRRKKDGDNVLSAERVLPDRPYRKHPDAPPPPSANGHFSLPHF